jgi:hypothetical protein
MTQKSLQKQYQKKGNKLDGKGYYLKIEQAIRRIRL